MKTARWTAGKTRYRFRFFFANFSAGDGREALNRYYLIYSFRRPKIGYLDYRRAKQLMARIGVNLLDDTAIPHEETEREVPLLRRADDPFPRGEVSRNRRPHLAKVEGREGPV